MAEGVSSEDRGLEVKDTFPEQPRPFRHIDLLTDIRGCRGGVKKAMWLQSAQYKGTVRVAIPRPDGFVDAVVPIDMLREALDEIEAFDPEAEP